MRILAAYLILLVHVMDTSIANVALLSITTDLMMDAYDGHWMITAFGIGMAGAIPFVPKVVEWLGAAAALSAVLLLSLVSIALCGVGDTFFVLVLSRFLQGVSSGAVVLLMQKLMMGYVGPERRAFGLALWTSAISIAPVIGPFLGAAIISFANWRWLFLGQVPVLIVAALVIRDEFALRPKPDGKRPGMLTALLFCGAMLCLELGLAEALDISRVDHATTWLYLFGAPLLLALLWLALSRQNTSLFDWSLLRNRAYLAYTGNAALLGAISVSTSLVYTLWLQVQLDLAVLDVAKVLAAGGLLAGGLTPFVGRIKQKQLFPLLIGVGLLCLTQSFFLCTQLTVNASLFDLILPRVLAGLGTALCSPSGFMAISELDPSRVLSANSLGMYMRTMCSNLLILLSAETMRRLEGLFSEQALANGFGTPVAGFDPAMTKILLGNLSRFSATDAMHAIYWAAIAGMVLLLASLALQNLRRTPSAPAVPA